MKHPTGRKNVATDKKRVRLNVADQSGEKTKSGQISTNPPTTTKKPRRG